MFGSLVRTLLEGTLLISSSLLPGSSASNEQSVLGSDSFQQELLQSWGQYSPWFNVPSDIAPAIPASCNVTFAQVLSRHGSRFPTCNKSEAYRTLINDIHNKVNWYGKGFEFIQSYNYTLSSDQLTPSGRRELFTSGQHFFDRYMQLAINNTPFVRAGGSERVIDSAENWAQGFHRSKTRYNHAPDLDYPYPMVIIPEGPSFNNPLCHGTCKAFEDSRAAGVGSAAKLQWAHIFVPPITDRINEHLLGANLTLQSTIDLMDLCPYDTVSSSNGSISPFCNIFTMDEWRQYDYYQSLDKHYGYGDGNPLGPTQGVGFVNELIARLTRTPVEDHTSTNRTLDNDSSTFPLDRHLYADFSHDNDMTSIYAALGLYSSTERLSNTTVETIEETKGYSAAYTVPFAARMYVEKLSCHDSPAEAMVRVLVNGRVLPLETCGGDELGRCSISRFIDSLAFARHGGRWDQC